MEKDTLFLPPDDGKTEDLTARHAFSNPTTDDHIPSPDDHQDGMQPPCPPHYVFSVYVTWPVSRHSEPLTAETDENRLSAHVTGRPRPPRRLQSERKVTTQSYKWEIVHI